MGAGMKKDSQAVRKAIIEKLDRLPVTKRVQVLEFVDHLASNAGPRGGGSEIYSYSSALTRQKGLKKLPLKKIAAIVHEVRNGYRTARGT